MLEELWKEVHGIVQEVVIKTIPKKKKCKKAKRLSEEDLQIAEKGREAKGKEEKDPWGHKELDTTAQQQQQQQNRVTWI